MSTDEGTLFLDVVSTGPAEKADLKGESEAIVRPEKANLMKRHIEKTKMLSEADLKALVDFLARQQ